MLPHGVINDDNKRRLASPWYYSICKAVTRGVFWVFEHAPKFQGKITHTKTNYTSFTFYAGAGVRGGFKEWPLVREQGAGDSTAPCSRNHQYCMDHGGPMDPFLPRDAKHPRY